MAQLFSTDSAARETLQNSTSVDVHINGTDFIMNTDPQIQTSKREAQVNHSRNLKILGFCKKIDV